MLSEELYNALPVSLQNAAISMYGYMWRGRRFGGIFKQSCEEFKARENNTVSQWHEYQTVQLRKLLLHAFSTVPYYNNAFKQRGVNETLLRKFELSDMHKLPLLSKSTFRKECRKGLISGVREKGGSFYSSSGSTGTPVSVLYSKDMHRRLSALQEARVRNWAGVTYKDNRAMIGGRRVLPSAKAQAPYYRYNVAEKQLYFSAYHISADTVNNYVEGLRKHGVQYMVGYAMSSYLLARLISEGGLQAPAMKAVLTSSEKLTPDMRAVISKVYDCKVFDSWSGVEWCGLISENEFGQLLISPDSAFIEVLKPDGTTALPGEEGELVCTGFLNFDQPLIRYKIGDVVRLSACQQTLCGRNFVVVDEIIGRSEDVVIGKDGRAMVRFHSIFLNLPNVLKGQVVQETTDNFTINVATKGLTDAERKSIKARMESQLGEINLVINETKDIPAGNNGKFKAVISKVVKG